MAEKKELTIAPKAVTRDPFAMLRHMTSELDRVFDDPFWPSFKWPTVQPFTTAEEQAWCPKIDVFEKDNRLVTKIDLPGMKKEDFTIEVTDGQLMLSGERKRESEETKDNVYRSECVYGSFYRAVPLPKGVKLEDMKATFADGVLEVSVPLPARAETKPLKIEITEPGKETKTAA